MGVQQVRLGPEHQRLVHSARLFLAMWDSARLPPAADTDARAAAAQVMWEAITGLHGQEALAAARQIAARPLQEERQEP